MNRTNSKTKQTFRKLRTINSNKKKLLDFVGAKSIKQFKSDNLEFLGKSNDIAYNYILDLYNDKIDEVRQESINMKKEMDKKQNVFIIVKKVKKLVFGTITYDIYGIAKNGLEFKLKSGFVVNFSFKINIRQSLLNKEINNELKKRRDRIIKSITEKYEDKIVKNFKYKVYIEDKNKPLVSVKDYKIKQENSINIDGFIDNEMWNITEGKCFLDWIQYYYKDVKRMKNKINTFNKIQDLSIDEEDYELDKEPNKNGYTIPHIVNFCNSCDISLYVLYNNELIQKLTSGNRNVKCLMIEIKNNHLYGVVDKKKIKSIITTNSSNDKIITNKKKNNDEEILTNIYLPKNNEDNINDLDFIIDIQKSRNLMIESGKKIIKTNEGLLPFKLGHELIITKHENKDMLDYCNDNNIIYKGQEPSFILKDYMKDIKKSNLNNDVYNALCKTDNVKNRTHHGFYNGYNEEDILNKKIPTGYDINKCYRSVMENPLDNFMNIDFKSEIIETEIFNNDFGLYFVETKDETLLKKNNWYSNIILKRAYNRGIVFNVKYFIKGNRIEKTLLKKIIDNIINTFNGKNSAIMKQVINSICGMLGKHKSEYTTLNIDTNYNEVWNFIKKNDNDNICFYEREGIYLFGKYKKRDLMDNNVPIYLQILDWGNILLDDLIIELGGYDNLMYRKTDYIVMDYNNKLKSANITDDIGGYKKEQIPIKFNYKINEDVIYHYYKTDWNKINDIQTSDDYNSVINHLKNSSLMINARAGTGKSFTIQKVIEHFGNDCIVLAPTNKSALNIKGKTIHKYFNINMEGQVKLENLVKKIKNKSILIIDEYSMITGDIWKHIYQLKRNSNLKFLIAGDNNQLPPIEDGCYDYEYINHPTIKYICDNNMVNYKLSKNSRYDIEMYDYLENIINNKIPNFKLDKMVLNDLINCVNICYTNKKRININRIVNNYHKNNKEHIFIDYVDNTEEKCKYRQSVYIYKGLKVSGFKTCKKNNISKNENYTIIDFNENYFIIKNDNNELVKILNKDFHYYFVIGYALTTHKAQGSTFKKRINIHEILLMKLDKKLLYTALSRGVNLANLHYYY